MQYGIFTFTLSVVKQIIKLYKNRRRKNSISGSQLGLGLGCSDATNPAELHVFCFFLLNFNRNAFLKLKLST